MNKTNVTPLDDLAEMRNIFLDLDRRIKEFGKKFCKHRTNKKKCRTDYECDHPTKDPYDINHDLECKADNCPLIIDGDDGT